MLRTGIQIFDPTDPIVKAHLHRSVEGSVGHDVYPFASDYSPTIPERPRHKP